MSHPRVEEVSDSDGPSDPSEVDIDDFADSDIMRRVGGGPTADAAPRSSSSNPRHASHPRAAANAAPPSAAAATTAPPDRAAYARFQCLYPVYFDASRSRAEGRRVSSTLAVHNPLAREVANACSRLRLPTVLEPDKTHPKDWANPGRVRVDLHRVRGQQPPSAAGGVVVRNKHHLFTLVAQHLREHPTTEESGGLRVRIAGQLQPEAGKPYPRPAVPRGWKMGELLPYTSAAMTGGGVSENVFKDMMKEMQGGGDPMAALMGGAGGVADEAPGGGSKRKDKKGKGRA